MEKIKKSGFSEPETSLTFPNMSRFIGELSGTPRVERVEAKELNPSEKNSPIRSTPERRTDGRRLELP